MLKNKNSAKISNFSKLLIGLTVFLTILYFLSFTKSCSSSDKREKVRTALVNQKYKDKINEITLQDAGASIELKNTGDFWTVAKITESQKGPLQLRIDLPASQERINNLLEELIKVRNLYKISDKISKNSSLGLTNGTEFHIRYTFTGDTSEDTRESFHELIFGNQDFSLSSRYMMSDKSTQVYEIDASMDNYLTTSIQSWAEPYIISREVLNLEIQSITASYTDEKGHKLINKIDGKSSGVNKLLDLRHGGLPASDQILDMKDIENSFRLEIENGDKTFIKLNIKPFDSGENYLVKTVYYDSEGWALYNSYCTISRWTYNKIKEITL